jgi:hypothetical protein
MKTTLLIITITLAAISISCGQQPPAPTPTYPPSGDLCVTLVAVDYGRVAEAFGQILGLKDENAQPRPATTAEVEAAMLTYVEGSTQDYERRKNMATFTPPPLSGDTKHKDAVGKATPKKK